MAGSPLRFGSLMITQTHSCISTSTPPIPFLLPLTQFLFVGNSFKSLLGPYHHLEWVICATAYQWSLLVFFHFIVECFRLISCPSRTLWPIWHAVISQRILPILPILPLLSSFDEPSSQRCFLTFMSNQDTLSSCCTHQVILYDIPPPFQSCPPE